MGVKCVGGVISPVCAVLLFSMTADYMYWQSQGKRGRSAKANKSSERASMFEYMHTLFVALHQSTSVSDSNYFVFFQQMCEMDRWIFTHDLF